MSSTLQEPNSPENDERESSDGLDAYAGRWVAWRGNRIIGQGGTPEQAARSAKASWFKEEQHVSYIPMTTPFLMPERLLKLLSALPEEREIYLIGGVLRDHFLGMPHKSKDFDFVLMEGALELGRKVADALDGAFYALDEKRGTARVILQAEDGERNILDFALMRGGDLESDLANRDFTINAMAVDIREPGKLLDPLGGLADLHAKRLRSCSNTTFRDDPLRILRAIRLAAGFKMRINLETRQDMSSSVAQLGNISAERLRDELFRILSGPQVATAIRALELLGVLPYILPELVSLNKLTQSAPHVSDVWEHTLETVRQLENVLEALAPAYDPDASASLIMGLLTLRIGRYREQISRHLQARFTPERNLRPLLFLAALYHDVGKVSNQQIDEDGTIHFYLHEIHGSELAKLRARELCLSTEETERLKKIVAAHMRPLHLVNTKETPTRRAIYRFFRDLKNAGIDVCLLSLADTLATYGSTLPQELWSRHLDLIRTLFDAWWENPEQSIAPPALVSGSDLIRELRLAPGPIIGRLLETIREAQATGDVSNYDQAIRIAKGALERLISEG